MRREAVHRNLFAAEPAEGLAWREVHALHTSSIPERGARVKLPARTIPRAGPLKAAEGRVLAPLLLTFDRSQRIPIGTRYGNGKEASCREPIFCAAPWIC
jgi:hypothetical protein